MKYKVVRPIRIGGKHYEAGESVNDEGQVGFDYLKASGVVVKIDEPVKSDNKTANKTSNKTANKTSNK